MKNFDIINSRILDQDNLGRALNRWRLKDEKIVFTNGCFDLIHHGHIHLLSKAADLGDRLVVGVNSDNSIIKIKGENRPINKQEARTSILASFSFVDVVIVFDEATPLELIKFIEPEVLVKGADYKSDAIVGADIIKQKGGKVAIIDLLEGYSTSSLVEKLNLSDTIIND